MGEGRWKRTNGGEVSSSLRLKGRRMEGVGGKAILYIAGSDKEDSSTINLCVGLNGRKGVINRGK